MDLEYLFSLNACGLNSTLTKPLFSASLIVNFLCFFRSPYLIMICFNSISSSLIWTLGDVDSICTSLGGQIGFQQNVILKAIIIKLQYNYQADISVSSQGLKWVTGKNVFSNLRFGSPEMDMPNHMRLQY